MIGRIRFNWSGVPCVVSLDLDLRWSCEPAAPGGCDVARYLGGLFDPREKVGPQHGWPGYATLHEAAAWLEGEVFDLRPIPESDPHAVY